MGRRVDWGHWKGLYVAGDDSVTFQSLSEMDGAPAFSTIRNKACPPKGSSDPSWVDLRKQYRKELAKESVGGDKVKLSVEQAIERTNKIIDTAEMLTQHNAIAQGLLALASQGIQATDGKQLKPSEISSLAKLGIDIQRTIEGMATSKTEVILDKKLEDMSADELIKLRQDVQQR